MHLYRFEKLELGRPCMPGFLGVDVGTKNIKAVILDETGRVVEEASTPVYDLVKQPREGFVERDPEGLWARVKETLAKLKRVGDVEGVCVDATSGTIVPIGRDGNPLYPLIMYNDCRAVEEAQELRQRSESAREFGKFLPIVPQLVLPRLMWLKKHTDFFGRIYKVLHESDYIVLKLTGAVATSTNTAGKSHALFDRLDYLREAYDDVEVSVDIMPELKPIGAVIGYVTREAAEETGLPPGVPVINGVTDATAGDITAGVFKAGQASVTIGTALTVHVVVDRLVPDELLRFYYKTYVKDLYIAGGFTNAGTPALDTIAALMGKSLDELTELAKEAPVGCEGLIACSEWFGVRVPRSYPNLRGFFVGLSERTAKPGYIFRSLLEASAITLKLMLEAVEEVTGTKVYDLRISGGASRNDLFMQIIADATGRSVRIVEEPHSAVGSAMLAMWGCTGEPLETIASKVVKFRAVFEPREETTREYGQLAEKYRRLVEALSGLV